MFAEIACIVTSLTTISVGSYAWSLSHRLRTDALTGLANRAELHRRFRRTVRWSRPRDTVAVLLADVNRFKQLNDTHGHRFGDRVLVEIATALEQAALPSELPVRLHGDEFAVLLTHPGTVDTAETRARDFATAVDAIDHLDGQPVDVSLSIGAATAPAATANLTGLIATADQRMYQNKHTNHASRATVPVGRSR